MANIPSSSDIVTNEQQPLINDGAEHEISHTPEMADSASRSGTVSSLAGTDNSTVHGRQPERSLWREEVEHRLVVAKERFQRNTGGFQIFKMPEYSYQPSEMFTPLAWRFGLHNLNNGDRYRRTETLKWGVPLLFGLDEMEKWEQVCEYVVPDHTTMLGCYGLHKEDINLKEEEMKHLLTVDALFIAWKIEANEIMEGNRNIWDSDYVTVSEEVENAFLSSNQVWNNVFYNDLFKVENQIPLELIKRAIEYIIISKHLPNSSNDNVQLLGSNSLDMWMKTAVRETMDVMFTHDICEQEITDLRLSGSHHILDAVYKAICGKEGLEQKCDLTQEEYIHIPSAISLKRAGVKIIGVAKPLCAMSYNKVTKCLNLPKIVIFDHTIAFIRNMEQYEKFMKLESSMFHDYIFLMLDLIDTPEDMKHLVKCGVIDNMCGSRAFEKWQPLEEGLTMRMSSKEHNAMKEAINRRYNQRLPKLWREFRTLFCSKPWLIVPIIAATLVTIATLIQTYAAVTGSDRMMPRYRNP